MIYNVYVVSKQVHTRRGNTHYFKSKEILPRDLEFEKKVLAYMGYEFDEWLSDYAEERYTYIREDKEHGLTWLVDIELEEREVEEYDEAY